MGKYPKFDWHVQYNSENQNFLKIIADESEVYLKGQSRIKEDEAKKDVVETNNQADHLIFETEKQIKELDGKMDKADAGKLQKSIDDLKKSKESQNIDSIKSSIEKLNSTWAEISQKIAASAQSDSPGTPAEPVKNPSNGDNVQEADFEVVDEEAK